MNKFKIFSVMLLVFALFACTGSNQNINKVDKSQPVYSAPVCESDESAMAPCTDCEISDMNDTNFLMTRHDFCLDIHPKPTREFSIRSMPKKYRNWPLPNYRHALFTWVRYPDGHWQFMRPVGMALFGAARKHEKVALQKSEVLKVYLDKLYPSDGKNTVAFSYLMFLDDTIIYIDKESNQKTNEYLVNALNKVQKNFRSK